jgi:predicted nuclease of predicted toxin-antitoxin system
MKFLVDMPLSPELAAWLVQHGHDAVHALDVGLERVSDAAILEWAQNEGRVIITADLDYPRLLALAHVASTGLILFRGGNYSEQDAIERLASALQIIPTDELAHSIIVIEKKRIRRRRLRLEPTS